MSKLKNFVAALNQQADDIHTTAVNKGWWKTERNDGEVNALIHSEVDEAYEAYEAGNPPSDKIPDFDSVSEELADVGIRLLDMTPARRWRIAEIIALKLEPYAEEYMATGFAAAFNATRMPAFLMLCDTDPWWSRPRIAAEYFLKLHVRLSQALEVMRRQKTPDNDCPDYSSVEVKMAEVLIEMLAMAHVYPDWRIAEAIVAKSEMNKGRSYRHGNKSF